MGCAQFAKNYYYLKKNKGNNMNIGDTVTTVGLVGTIVGVSQKGNPVVEWWDGDFEEHFPEDLIQVELPKPNEELDPAKEEEVANV